MAAKKATKKKTAAKKPVKKQRVKTRVVYREREDHDETGMHEMTHMAMDGAVFMGGLGLMSTMAGAVSKK